MRFIKRALFVILTIYTVSYTFPSFLTKQSEVILIFASIILLLIDTFFKKIINDNLISLFISEKYPRPDWIIKTSNFFISIACILSAYRLGLGIDIFLKLEYIPSNELLKNLDVIKTLVILIMCAVYLNMYWSFYAIIKEQYNEIDKKADIRHIIRQLYISILTTMKICIKNMIVKIKLIIVKQKNNKSYL